jgi:hypothetical protein
MSKTNDTSRLDRVKIETRVLADSELDAVSGGFNILGGSLPGPSEPQPIHGHTKMSDIVLKHG